MKWCCIASIFYWPRSGQPLHLPKNVSKSKEAIVGITLKGLTWDHPRGFAPLLGGIPEYEEQNPEVKIQWDRRTLRQFGEAPIEQYLDRYDLIIVDHPFVGFAAVHDVLVDLAPFLSETEKLHFAADSVGPSWQSYWYGRGLWAFPIDAATQVASYRPDLLGALSPAVPATFDDVLELGEKARKAGKYIVVPACPTDAISLFFTLSANLGYPIAEESERFVGDSVAADVLDRLHSLIGNAHPRSVEWNPIQVYDFMVGDSGAVYCPLGFGYSNYSRVGNAVRLKFTNAPSAGQCGCAGTMLGGTGIAVSKFSPHSSEAIAYAKWLASPEHQSGTYFREGGQPASLRAWADSSINAMADGFFSATLQSMQTAYLRPRFDGFVRFFEAAGVQINRCLRGELEDASLIRWLNDRYSTQRVAARRLA
jgi:multiple sugar transport system substrate-binding protein